MTAKRLHGAMTKQHAHTDRGDDLYETPAVAVRALLKAEKLPHRIWEPACGPGAIVRVLEDAGHSVFASDLRDYGLPGALTGADFLRSKFAVSDIGAIVTNPPYKHATEFVERAILLVPKVAMLLRLAFLESERRRRVLDTGHLARVHVFRNRLPMMHRAGWEGPKTSSATQFAWFVWERDYDGPATLNRISWEP